MRNVSLILGLVTFLLIISFSGAGCATEIFELRPFKRQLSFTGFTRPQKELVVSSEVSGRCKAVLLEQGDTVAPSGFVAEMDSTFIELDLNKNRIAQEQAKSQLELEKKTLSRYTTLIKTNSAAQATYDDAVLRADIHTLALRNLENEEVRLQELIRRHTLLGPAGWKVMARFVEPGEFIRQGEQVIRLGDFRQLVIPFFLTYEEINLLKKTEKIRLFVPDLGVDVESRIFRVAPGFNEKTRKIPVDLIVDADMVGTEISLRGGMRVLLKLAGKKEDGSFFVPFSALISRYDTHWLTTEDGERKNVILLGKSEDVGYAVVAGAELVAGESFLVYPEPSVKQSE